MSKTTIPPLDLMFYLTETSKSPKHVGAVQVFKMPPKAPANYLRDLVADFKKAEIISPFNRKPVFPRFGLPEWREDKDIEINYHVRHSALPKPGDIGQLMEVVQRLHSPMLDRDRPGWIFQLIEGLEGNRFAIYNKIHHAYIDGMSGAKRMYASLSASPGEKKIWPSCRHCPTSAASPGQGDRPVTRVLRCYARRPAWRRRPVFSAISAFAGSNCATARRRFPTPPHPLA